MKRKGRFEAKRKGRYFGVMEVCLRAAKRRHGGRRRVLPALRGSARVHALELHEGGGMPAEAGEADGDEGAEGDEGRIVFQVWRE